MRPLVLAVVLEEREADWPMKGDLGTYQKGCEGQKTQLSIPGHPWSIHSYSALTTWATMDIHSP